MDMGFVGKVTSVLHEMHMQYQVFFQVRDSPAHSLKVLHESASPTPCMTKLLLPEPSPALPVPRHCFALRQAHPPGVKNTPDPGYLVAPVYTTSPSTTVYRQALASGT